MKHLRKLLVAALTLIAAFAIATPAFAANQGTLTVSNAMKGQDYTAYKIFNAVYADEADPSKGVNYTVPASLEDQVSSPFVVGTAVASNGEKIVTVASDATDEQVIAWAKENYSKFDSTGQALTYNDTDGTASATVDYGYYYVTSGLGSMVTIDSVHDEVTIVDKNESKPVAPEKIITAENSSVITALNLANQALETNDAAVGSVESFQVSFNATNWVSQEESDSTPGTGTGDKTKVTVWNFTDTPTGLSIDASTVKITVNGTAIYENGASVDTTNVTTVTGGGTDALAITIPWVNATGASLYATQTEGSELIPVVITYNATVTSDAATAVAPNNVVVKYNNDTELGSDTTSTYTFKFQLDKTKNAANNYEALTGAKFQLYASDGETLLKFDQDGTTYTFNATGTVDTLDLTESATALIQGLDKADYVLKEVQAPSGYNKADDLTVKADQLVRVDSDITDGEGIADDSGVVTVVNEQGTALPSTGGIGTTIFYIVGGALLIGGIVMFVTKRRVASIEK